MNTLTTAASQCYGKNVTAKGLQNIINSGHLSVLEHCVASFEVKCSVRVLGQLTRHRHLNFTVKSTRGADFGFDDIMVPEELDGEDNAFWRERYDMTTAYLINEYKQAQTDGISKQTAAYLLPQGLLTKMVVTGNFRAWFEYLPKRQCKRALPEHYELAEDIGIILATEIPEVFNRNFMKCGDCTESGCDFK